MGETPVFSTSLHGFQCKRGQLWLSDEETAYLSEFLDSYGFRFQLETAFPVCPNNKKRKADDHEHLTSAIQTLKKNDALRWCPDTAQGETGQKGDIEELRNDHKFPNADAQHHPSAPGKPVSGAGKGAKSATSAARMTPTSDNPSVDKPQGSPSNPIRAKTVPRYDAVPRSSCQAYPVRMTRRCRRKMLTGDWVEACLEVTKILEKEPTSQWFLTLVDPNSKSLHDYLAKLSCPMDFNTIRQKLTHRMYTHPFRWQEDVRTIFYNAFTYYEPGNLIWSNACYLAELFERLCQEKEGVNPYAVYGTSRSRNATDMYTKSPSQTGSRSTKMRASTSNVSHRTCEAATNPEEVMSSISNMFSKSNKIVLEASKLRELLEKAATVAQHGGIKDGDIQECGKKQEGSSHLTKRPLALNEASTDPVHFHRSSGNLIPYSSSTSYGGDKKNGAEVSPSMPQMPPPTMPPPPPPPLVTTMVPGDRIPSTIHQRLVSSQFRQLDIHLRRCALDLVKDELGIVPSIGACDPEFKLDLEILSFLKQKQLLTYLRTLNMFQRKKVEEGYTPTLTNHFNASQPPPPSSPSVSNQSISTPTVTQSVLCHGDDSASHHKESSSRASMGTSHNDSDKTAASLKFSALKQTRATMFVPNSSSRFQGTSTSSSSTYSSSSSLSSQDDDDDDDDDDNNNNKEEEDNADDDELSSASTWSLLNAFTEGQEKDTNHILSPGKDVSKFTPQSNVTNEKVSSAQSASDTVTPRPIPRDSKYQDSEPGYLPAGSSDTVSSPLGTHVNAKNAFPNHSVSQKCSETRTAPWSNTTFTESPPMNQDSVDVECSCSLYDRPYANLHKETLCNGIERDAYFLDQSETLSLDITEEQQTQSPDVDIQHLDYYLLNDDMDTNTSCTPDAVGWQEGKPEEKRSSAWSEWMAKVIQQKIQIRIGDEENQELLATGDPENERAAELADAQI